MDDIGSRIFECRTALGLSQEELAEKLGVSRQSVSKWEGGSVLPDADKIVAMGALFGVTTDHLLTGRDSGSAAAGDTDKNADAPVPPVYRTEDNDGADDPGPQDRTNAAEDIPPHGPDGEAPAGSGSDVNKTKRARQPRKLALRIISTVLAVGIVVCAVLFIPFGGASVFTRLTEAPVVYTAVFVHGMGGWGSAAVINESSPYWGASTGSLTDWLISGGYSAAEATVGPFSSAWDRACELYAQLTGTTVDYGAAHSAAAGHSRYGRTYTQPIVSGWGGKTPGGQRIKIDLIGHSFGGNTIRLLASLLEYGCADETAASPDDVSPLFTGGKGDWVNSVTTLCAPHNGSTLYYAVGGVNMVSYALKLIYALAGVNSSAGGGCYDFMLEQFGIDSSGPDAVALVNKKFSSGSDNAFYDLSPDGAAVLNDLIRTDPQALYFSYSYCTTEKSALTGLQIPLSSTLPVLKATALLMGCYTRSAGAGGTAIDDSWLPNDGLVNVVSAQYPSDEAHADYTGGDQKISRGIWYVMPLRTGDHGTVIGLGAGVDETHKFYTDLYALVDSCRGAKTQRSAEPETSRS